MRTCLYDSGRRTRNTAYQRDAESGLDYAINRYYANTSARFVSVDQGPAALWAPQTLNRYPYVANDPINNLDPDGNCIQQVYTGNNTWTIVPCPAPPPLWLDVWTWTGLNRPLDSVATMIAMGGSPAEGVTWGVQRAPDKARLVSGAVALLGKQKCADFVVGALQKGFLDENGVGSPDQLGNFERGIYDGLTAGAVIDALNAASFVYGGASPKTTENGVTYTTMAQANYVNGGTSTVTFYNDFFARNNTGQAQTALHEGMHLIWNISDINFAKAVGVYQPGMSEKAASNAWNAKLQENCK